MATFTYQKRRDCKYGGKYGNQGPYPRFTPQNLQFSIFSSSVHLLRKHSFFRGKGEMGEKGSL